MEIYSLTGSVPVAKGERPLRPSERLDGRNHEAALLEFAERLWVGSIVGDQLIYIGQLADPREGDRPELGAVCDHDHLARATHQSTVRACLDLVVGGKACRR